MLTKHTKPMRPHELHIIYIFIYVLTTRQEEIDGGVLRNESRPSDLNILSHTQITHVAKVYCM